MVRRLEWLEAMRAAAACWVLLHHANQSVTAFVGPLGFDETIFLNGYLGVDFFFVLSGFIIAYSTNRLLQTGRGFADYAKARSIRIYIPYLPIGIAMLVLYQILPGLSAGERSPGILTSLTLLPTASPTALSVAWTLVHEMLFYALFSLIFLSKRILWTVLALWAVLIAIQFWVGQPFGREGWGYVLSPVNLCFLLGVAVYYLTRTGVATGVAVASALVGFAVVAFEATRVTPDRWLIALGFAGLIICASSAWAQKQSPGRVALLLGAASYSIYLVHNPFLSVAVRALRKVMPGISPLPAFLLMALAALAAGLAYYYFYERHGLKLAKKYSSKRAVLTSNAQLEVITNRDSS